MNASKHTRRTVVAAAMALGLAATGGIAHAQAPKPEKADVTLAIGGASTQMYFLPLILADQLGYFKDAGINMKMIVTGSGAKGLQALVSGGADLTAGSYEHPIRLQARGQDIKAVVKFGLWHGNVLGIVSHRAKDYKSPKDMKGWKVGVSAPGSSSQLFAALLLSKHGLAPNDVSYIAVTQGVGGIAAVRTGKELDAISLTDPSISELENSKDIVVVADSRTRAGTVEVYGGETISGVIYSRGDFIKANPNTVQAIATAMVRALEWTKTASADDIMAKVPKEFWADRPELYKTMVEKNITSFQHDGRFPVEATEVTMNFLRQSDPALRDVKLDLTKTYDNTFVDKARAALGLK